MAIHDGYPKARSAAAALTLFRFVLVSFVMFRASQAAVHLLVLPRLRVEALEKLTRDHLPMLK